MGERPRHPPLEPRKKRTVGVDDEVPIALRRLVTVALRANAREVFLAQQEDAIRFKEKERVEEAAKPRSLKKPAPVGGLDFAMIARVG